jgi:F0F1-type ATP synthase assembly protein I
MRQKTENPAWWALYAIWIAGVLVFDVEAPFRTILFASILAGVLHGITQSLLLDRYIANNPWYADQMQAPRRRLAMQFIMMGVAVGTAFGALVAGIAWGLARVLG